jgi:hypothetical protein
VIRGMIQRASGKEALESTLQQIYFDANGLPQILRQGQARMGVSGEGVFGMSFRGCWVMSDLGVFLGLVDWLRYGYDIHGPL